MIALVRKKADCYGVAKGGERYDALLNEYEPGATAREIETIFTPLRSRLAGFIAEIARSKSKPSDKPLHAKIEADRQHKFGQFVLGAMGFDLKAGRLDVTTHPFCSEMGPSDVRTDHAVPR
jgi:carboxypeptidase Taq